MKRYILIVLCFLAGGCSLTTTAASVERDRVFEEERTRREEQFYNRQLALMEKIEKIASTPLISITTPETKLPDGTVLKGTTVTINREMKIPELPQYVNQPTFGQQATLAGIAGTVDIIKTIVPFAGAAYSVRENRKILESQYQYQVRRDEVLAGMYEAAATSTPVSHTTNTENYTYGENSGNEIGGDYQNGDIDSSTRTFSLDSHDQRDVGNDKSSQDSHDDYSQENTGNEQWTDNNSDNSTWTDNHDESPAVFQPVTIVPPVFKPVITP